MRKLLRGLAIFFIALSIFSMASVFSTPHTTNAQSWVLQWSDEFSGAANTGVDTNNWKYDTGNGIFGTGEIETMTNSTANVYQDGAGHLVLKAIGSGSNWTSGRIETQRSDFQPPAGGIMRIESSIQQPNLSGAAAAGYWPAFWMLGGTLRTGGVWPDVGEWDILEDINGRSSVFGTLHCGVNPGGPCNESTGIGSGERACSGCQTGFHTYAIEYDTSVSPEQLRWYLDGSNYFTINATQVDATTWNHATHRGNFLIYDLAMGGGFPSAFGGGPTASTQSGGMLIADYVRVYYSGGSTPPTNTPVPTGDGNPYTGTPINIPGKIEAENFNTGGEGVAYHDAEAANQGGQYRTSEGVDIEATTDTGAGYDVGWTATGEWEKYTVNIANSGSYNLDFRVASAQAGAALHLEVDGANVTGSLAVPNTGGWQTWTDVTKTGVNLSAGKHVLRLYVDTAGYNINWINITQPTPPTNTPSPVPTNTPIPSGDGNPFSGSPYAIPGKVEAENYNTGGEGVAYHDADAANQGGQYRTADGVDIEVSTDTGGGYNVGWTAAGEWMKYTVNVASSASYNFTFRVASNQAGGLFHLEVDNTNVTGSLTVPNTGGWQVWTNVMANNISVSAGQHVFKWVTDAAGGNYNYFSVASAGGATNTPTFVPTNGPTATKTNVPPPTATSSGVAAWDPNSHPYNVGDLVTYNGHTYKCLQAHTSQAGWDPVSAPALWQFVS